MNDTKNKSQRRNLKGIINTQKIKRRAEQRRIKTNTRASLSKLKKQAPITQSRLQWSTQATEHDKILKKPTD